LAAELIVPGFFLVWIGLAALIVGAMSLLFWDSAFWVWELQAILFALLAVATTPEHRAEQQKAMLALQRGKRRTTLLSEERSLTMQN
ncbi:NfeD family protein, partial [Rhizobium ruizarguesonis]